MPTPLFCFGKNRKKAEKSGGRGGGGKCRNAQKWTHKKRGKLLGKTWDLRKAETGNFGGPKNEARTKREKSEISEALKRQPVKT